MQHKPAIYVSHITNLSDARYCAGMGVDILGFVVDPSSADFVSAEDYQAMVGWISGPKRAIEVSNFEHVDWDKMIDAYKPDLLHVQWKFLDNSLPDLPLLVELTLSDVASMNHPTQPITQQVDHWIVTGLPEGNTSLLPKNLEPALLSIDSNGGTLRTLLLQTGAKGFALKGTQELAPGLKDYDHLSRVLEELLDEN